MTSRQHARYQAVALLARTERARIQADDTITEAQRDNFLRAPRGRGDQPGAARRAPAVPVLAAPGGRRDRRRHPRAAARDDGRRRARGRGGGGPGRAPPYAPSARRSRSPSSRPSWPTRSSSPDFSQAAPRTQGRLVGWELIGPLLNAFEHPTPGAPACMELPEPRATQVPKGTELMPHQARWSPPSRAATARSCSPTSPASARPPRRCWPRRPPTPTRCSPSSPTSSRPTGPARPSCGPPASRCRSSTATATRSTASPTSTSSTTRSSTATSTGSASTASAAWSSTRPTTSRTRSRSAPSRSSRSPSGYGAGWRGRC